MEDKIFELKSKQNRYILYFFIYSFLGWAIETIYSFIVLGHFVNRGFLLGPICPIYGFGMLIITIFLSKFKDNIFKLFTISTVILTIFEYITSFVLYALFQLKWWDYTPDFMNINGRIALFYSFSWGIISIIVIKFIHPIIEKLTSFILEKISKNINLIIKIMSTIFFADIILSTIQYLQ